MAIQTEFKLDTSSFAESAANAKILAENLEDAIARTDNAINTLYTAWAGKGRNEFESKYKIFEQQVADIKNGLWDLYEDIVGAEEDYIKADCEASKKLDGKNSDYS